MSGSLGSVALAVLATAVGSLFAAADAAITSVPEARLQVLAADSPGFARYAAARERVLSRWLVGRVVAISLAAPLFATASDGFGPVLGPLAAVVGTLMTYAVFAEIGGVAGRRRPEQIGRFALRWLRPLELALIPIAEPLAALARWVGSAIPEAPAGDARMTETEVEWAVAQGEKAGAIGEEPAEMIRKVLEFKELTAREVMIPRKRMSAFKEDTPLAQVLERVIEEGHSRYPVYREGLDDILGLLYVKDLFELVHQGRMAKAKLEELIRQPVLFVAETQPALSVLREMRAKRLHLAIVSDEFGGTSGLVTLEDIIEEIVGDIEDEYDAEDSAPIQKLAEGRFVADAAISLGDLEHHLGRRLPDDGDFESLGGLMVHRVGRVPEVGAIVSLDGFRLIVREADETRIVKVEIVRSEPELAPPT
ncbi:MAG: HlyC/CorC family transporter [Myxococcales bacterium]|nr:HlyC/CorC family transporter [Myxococcales bacterium]